MKVEVKKLWKGMVSVRDYTVKKAVSQNEDLEIKFKGQTMTLTPSQLKRGHSDGITHMSKYEGAYMLIDYNWIPDKYTVEYIGSKAVMKRIEQEHLF